MKTLKALFKDKFIFWCFALITTLSLIVYFRDYSTLVIFDLDSPSHLAGARDIVESGKINLIGPIDASKEMFGRQIFFGAFYYYALEILGILSSWNVIAISAFFTFLWILAFIAIFLWFYKSFGGTIALLIYSLLSFCPIFVSVSRQILNTQFVPIFGVMFLMLLVNRRKKIHYFLAGVFWGLGLNVHYATALWLFIALWFLIDDLRKKRFAFSNWLLLAFGGILAESPFLLFELRHNFYNIQTVFFHIKYFKLSQGYTFAVWYYYVYTLLPVVAYLVASVLKRLRKSRVFYPIIFLGMLLSTYFLVQSLGPGGHSAFYPKGWSIERQKNVTQIIINDNPKQFEVARTLSSDTRAMDLRWWLREAKVPVMDVVSYNTSPVLYLVTTPERPPETETVWEVSSLRPFNIEFKKDIGGGLYLYKLVRK
jgi:hypothetical protein